MSADLFEPFQLGDLTLANRMVMAPLNEADPSTFHGGSEAGYTDYPFYRGEQGGEANI